MRYELRLMTYVFITYENMYMFLGVITTQSLTLMKGTVYLSQTDRKLVVINKKMPTENCVFRRIS